MEDQYNLIYNGKMLHGMDGYCTGFSNQTYGIDTSDKPVGCTSSYLVFSNNSTSSIMFNNQGFFPLIPYIKEDIYNLHFQIKTNASYDKLSSYNFCIKSYDNKGYPVWVWNTLTYEPNGSTITTLAQDLNNGDTTVYLTDASKWVANQTYRYLGIIESAAYKDDRMLYGQKITQNSIDVTNNTLTLQAGWSGGTYKAGSKVREFTDGANFYYPISWTSSTIPDDWTEYNIEFKPFSSLSDYTDALKQAYYVALGMHGGSRVKMADFRFENITSLQPRIPNMEVVSKNNNYQARFNDYTESTSSVNQYGQLNTGMLSEGFLPVRYIRDSMNGSDKSSNNIWREIQAFDRWRRNVAFAADGTIPGSALIFDDNNVTGTSRYGLNKANTTTFKPLHCITQGTYHHGYIQVSNAVFSSVTIDMGIVHYIDKIVIWHYHNDSRTFHNTKTEVSVDGVNWITVFDSAIEGEYVETAAGHTITFDKLGILYHASMRKGGETLVQDVYED